MAELVDAYRTDTGEKVRIPSDWIDHPVLGEPFTVSPRQPAGDDKASKATKTPAAGEKE